MQKSYKNIIPTPPREINYCHSEPTCRPELVSGSVSESKNLRTPNGYNPHLRRGNEFAFTLAEVLITLVIIGVIAAITVPTLITKYQKEQTVTKLKKAYSALSQTTARAIADNGPINTWTVGRHFNAEDTVTFINKYLSPYLSIMKKPTTSDVGHWNKNFYYLNGNETSYENYWVRYYLNDGISITSTFYNDGCQYLRLRIDINGDKKPNIFGKDIFAIYYYISCSWGQDYDKVIGKFAPDRLYATREEIRSNPNYGCNKTGTQSGGYCTALIMKDGWRIADDYPW